LKHLLFVNPFVLCNQTTYSIGLILFENESMVYMLHAQNNKLQLFYQAFKYTSKVDWKQGRLIENLHRGLNNGPENTQVFQV
jgi:hypothetical protein